MSDPVLVPASFMLCSLIIAIVLIGRRSQPAHVPSTRLLYELRRQPGRQAAGPTALLDGRHRR